MTAIVSAQELGKALVSIEGRVEKINQWEPLSAMVKLYGLQRELKSLRQPFYDLLRGLGDDAVTSTVSGMGIPGLNVTLQHASAATLLNWHTVQIRWHDVESALDRKQAWSLGVLSVYISVLSLLLAIAPIACSMMGNLPDQPHRG
jgi:hypothetical protein